MSRRRAAASSLLVVVMALLSGLGWVWLGWQTVRPQIAPEHLIAANPHFQPSSRLAKRYDTVNRRTI